MRAPYDLAHSQSRSIRALNGEEHPAASNDIATGRSGELLFWKLVRENSELVDLRCFGKQVAGLGFFHQGRRHLAVEMRVAPGLVVERVEDGERGRSFLNGEPRDRAHLSVHQWYGGAQKLRDLLLLARLRLLRNV